MVVYPFRTNNSLNSLTKPVRLKWLDMFSTKSPQTVKNEDPTPPPPLYIYRVTFFPRWDTSDVCHVTWVIDLFGYNRRLSAKRGARGICVSRETSARRLFLSSPRFALRANCWVHFAWLIKRLLCRVLLKSMLNPIHFKNNQVSVLSGCP